jgi:glucokinase
MRLSRLFVEAMATSNINTIIICHATPSAHPQADLAAAAWPISRPCVFTHPDAGMQTVSVVNDGSASQASHAALAGVGVSKLADA